MNSTLTITCPGCKKRVRIKSELAGKKVKCSCGQKVLVPSIAASSPPHDDFELPFDPAPPPNQPEPNPFNSSNMPAAPDRSITGRPTKFCQACGTKIDKEAVICVSCGVKQADVQERPRIVHHEEKKSQTTAAVFAIFLGGIGIHKFYLGQPVLGVLYIVFCWTFIPAIIGFVEGIIYLVMSRAEFNRKYNSDVE